MENISNKTINIKKINFVIEYIFMDLDTKKVVVNIFVFYHMKKIILKLRKNIYVIHIQKKTIYIDDDDYYYPKHIHFYNMKKNFDLIKKYE